MEKKNYIQPAFECYGVKISELILSSGTDRYNMSSGSSSDDAPTSTTQNGVTGIFGESKGSQWDDGEE